MQRANLATSLILGLTVAACGGRLGLTRPHGKSEHAPPSNLAPITVGLDPKANDQGASLPPETKVLTVALAEGLSIPRVLKANSLVAKFASNENAVNFECERDGNGRFQPCQPGGVYDFGRLIHQRGYSLTVRARSEDGRLSPVPLKIRFSVDLITGTAPVLPPNPPKTIAPEVTSPGSAVDLPPVLSAPPVEASLRGLLLGAFYAVDVPFDTRVITYATSKTYNGRLLTITMLNAPINTLFTQNNSCQRPYEKIVMAKDQVPYCEGTPNLEDLAANTVQMPPLNFVNLALNLSGGILSENLLLAAFEGDSEPVAEANIRLNQCRTDLPRGSVTLPIIPKFYGGLASGTIDWCQYQDGAGLWWWGAVVTSALGSESSRANLKLYYSVSSALGILTETQLIDRLKRQVFPLLMPIADVP